MSPPSDPTPRSDYAHWNEEQDWMWWNEVGRFSGDEDPPEPDEEYEYPDHDTRDQDDIG